MKRLPVNSSIGKLGIPEISGSAAPHSSNYNQPNKAHKSLSRILCYVYSISVLRKGTTGAGLQGFRCLKLRTIASFLSEIANNLNKKSGFQLDISLGTLFEIANLKLL
jgi:hypothetical protein